MKQNIDFYQHFVAADQHAKFKMLRVEFGWAGEGKFWALNNRIGQAERCCLDISKKYNMAAISCDLDFTKKELSEFIAFLLGECELIYEINPGVITTEIIQENFQMVMSNREKARGRKKKKFQKVPKGSGELLEGSGERNNKGKERKLKGTKGKENKPIPDFEKSESDAPTEETYKTKSGKTLEGKRLKTFKEFWSVFNYKQGKAEAAEVWLKIKPFDDSIVEQVLSAAKREADNRGDLLQRGKTPKMAQGWLSGRRWEDEATNIPQQDKPYSDITQQNIDSFKRWRPPNEEL